MFITVLFTVAKIWKQPNSLSIVNEYGTHAVCCHFCCIPLFCDFMDCSLPGSSVNGVLQARILEWVAKFSPADLPDPGVKVVSVMSPSLAGVFFITSTTWEALQYIYTLEYYSARGKKDIWHLICASRCSHT